MFELSFVWFFGAIVSGHLSSSACGLARNARLKGSAGADLDSAPHAGGVTGPQWSGGVAASSHKTSRA